MGTMKGPTTMMMMMMRAREPMRARELMGGGLSDAEIE